MLTLLYKFFYKFVQIFAVSKLLLTLGINALQEFMYCYLIFIIGKVVEIEKFKFFFQKTNTMASITVEDFWNAEN